jgi:hypothetical protein
MCEAVFGDARGAGKGAITLKANFLNLKLSCFKFQCPLDAFKTCCKTLSP